MKVKIENFGPIHDGEFELGDITVIIGPNASGKSFISLLLYSVLGTRILTNLKDLEGIKRISNEINLSSYLTVIDDILSRHIKKRLEKTFGVQYKDLISFQSKESKISLSSSRGSIDITMGDEFKVITKLNKDINIFINYIEEKEIPFGSITTKVDIGKLDSDDTIKIEIYYGSNAPEILKSNLNKLLENERKRALITIIINVYLDLLFGKYRPVTILPTERNLAISNFIGYLSTYISLEKLSKNIDKPIVRIFIRNLLNSMRIFKNKKFSINMSNLNLQYKVVEPFVLEIYENDKRILIPLLSSGYSQIIPIDIVAKLGRFIIIEEPELNLHAGAQIDMANYLSNMAQGNKKLFLTTHSDLFTIQMTINHVKRNDKNKTLKIYLLNNGKIEEIKYTDKGDVEEIPTISEVIRNQVKEIYGE
ncbi:AAA family ATPase [Metallosphaera hakonensis]|uniref:Endonuclease GajA/Old nuclease/RecF-like AAA domain-containing protein n=2 Tax=Metallosphaera hakonensis TaxID=79601 RepID=A0A2U9IQQ6_9CREN|nr:AAA family ATPase [Metallosphaera hakonensis]AWR98379.1 AAA family ATPase [Metallosphaera hakonensis JCM 8857 = DSM 7519]